VPARFDPSEPAALMVFQDGSLYLDPTGEMRAGIVLDNLVHRGEICGGSSGGNCALTVAWHRPDRFRRVVSFLGSFAQMPGGNPYPATIRDEPAKPLRIFMQAGTRDLDAAPATSTC
jgi:enterochelin esterase-like enzyme